MDPALLSATIEAAADAILTVDLNGKIGHYNRKFLNLWGLAEARTSQQTLFELARLMGEKTKDPAGFREFFEGTFLRSQPVRQTIEMRDGRLCELHAEPLFLEGSPSGMVLSFRTKAGGRGDHPADDRRFHILFANMQEAALLMKMVWSAGGVDFIVEEANPAFERLSGLRREAAVGSLASRLFGFVFPADAAFQRRAFTTPLQPGKPPFRLSLFPVGEDSFVCVMQEPLSKRIDAPLTESLQRLRGVFESTVQAIAITVETRDPYTAGHQRRAAELACAIAEEMGLSAEQTDCIRTAALIHDIGKISVPAEILSKPTLLSMMELSLIKTHPQAGYDILKDIAFPWPIARVVLEHHERLDGSGYPNGLSGDELLLESRVLSVADVVEAIASNRPYRPAHSLDKAMEEIWEKRGVLYDDAVVSSCLSILKEKRFYPT